MVPIARCAWSAQNAEESLGSATTEGCAKSDQRLRSNLPYLGKSSRRETILQDSSAKKDKRPSDLRTVALLSWKITHFREDSQSSSSFGLL